jgi:hypothetical protein
MIYAIKVAFIFIAVEKEAFQIVAGEWGHSSGQ